MTTQSQPGSKPFVFGAKRSTSTSSTPEKQQTFFDCLEEQEQDQKHGTSSGSPRPARVTAKDRHRKAEGRPLSSEAARTFDNPVATTVNKFSRIGNGLEPFNNIGLSTGSEKAPSSLFGNHRPSESKAASRPSETYEKPGGIFGLFGAPRPSTPSISKPPSSECGTAAPSLFGASTPTQTSGGLFSACANSNKHGHEGAVSGQRKIRRLPAHSTKDSPSIFDPPPPQSGIDTLSLFGGLNPSNHGQTPSAPSKGISLFGGPPRAPAYGGLFGSSTPAQSSAGLFGSSTPAQTSGGLFGASATAQASNGLFGSTTPAQKSGGLLGASTPAQDSSRLFGTTAPAQISGSLFEAPSQASGGLFGASTPTQTSDGLFGASTPARASDGLFGGLAPTQEANGLFEASASNQAFGGLFGTSTSARPSGGHFGTSTPVQTSSGLFGASTPAQASSGLFATTTPVQPSGSLFGAATPARASGGIFGALKPAQTSSRPFGSSAPAQSPGANETGLLGQDLQTQADDAWTQQQSKIQLALSSIQDAQTLGGEAYNSFQQERLQWQDQINHLEKKLEAKQAQIVAMSEQIETANEQTNEQVLKMKRHFNGSGPPPLETFNQDEWFFDCAANRKFSAMYACLRRIFCGELHPKDFHEEINPEDVWYDPYNLCLEREVLLKDGHIYLRKSEGPSVAPDTGIVLAAPQAEKNQNKTTDRFKPNLQTEAKISDNKDKSDTSNVVSEPAASGNGSKSKPARDSMGKIIKGRHGGIMSLGPSRSQTEQISTLAKLSEAPQTESTKALAGLTPTDENNNDIKSTHIRSRSDSTPIPIRDKRSSLARPISKDENDSAKPTSTPAIRPLIKEEWLTNEQRISRIRKEEDETVERAMLRKRQQKGQ